MTEKKTVPASPYEHALYTIGVLSNALTLAVAGTSIRRTVQGDSARRENFVTEGRKSFDALTAEDQDQVIGVDLKPLGSVVVEGGKLTSKF